MLDLIIYDPESKIRYSKSIKFVTAYRWGRTCILSGKMQKDQFKAIFFPGQNG